jgi:hypothetical protein
VRENLFGHLAILAHMSLSLFGNVPDLPRLSRRQNDTVFVDEQETKRSDISGLECTSGKEKKRMSSEQ